MILGQAINENFQPHNIIKNNLMTHKIKLEGLRVIEPQIFEDCRGFFFESFQEERYRELGTVFVQDNHSYSRRGVIRGMHFQSTPGQAKLIRVVVGKIYDVAVDIRPDSPTFGQWEGIELDGESHRQLFIPVGFAHGFCVLSKEAHVLYKTSSPYVAATEKGFRYNDPEIGIEWPVKDPIVSERDQMAPLFKDLEWA